MTVCTYEHIIVYRIYTIGMYVTSQFSQGTGTRAVSSSTPAGFGLGLSTVLPFNWANNNLQYVGLRIKMLTARGSTEHTDTLVLQLYISTQWVSTYRHETRTLKHAHTLKRTYVRLYIHSNLLSHTWIHPPKRTHLKTCSFCSQVSSDRSTWPDSTPCQLRPLSISSYTLLVLLGKGLQGVEWGEEHTTRRVAHHQSSAGTGYTPTHNKHTHSWWGTVVCGSGGWTTHMYTSHLFCTHQFKIQ